MKLIVTTKENVSNSCLERISNKDLLTVMESKYLDIFYFDMHKADMIIFCHDNQIKIMKWKYGKAPVNSILSKEYFLYITKMNVLDFIKATKTKGRINPYFEMKE